MSSYDAMFDSMEARINHPLSVDVRKRLLKHLELVIEKNSKVNLTRITSIDDALLLHVEDSLLGLAELSAAPSGEFFDLGTGAGFPGIPLAIVSGRHGTLDDSSKKKAAAVTEFVRKLQLDGLIHVSDARCEEFAQNHRGAFSVVVTRAVAQLSSLLELSNPLLSVHGHLIAYKAHPTQDELDAAQRVASLLFMRLVSRRVISLCEGKYVRTLLSYEKLAEPDMILPRRNGLAQKRPLA
jgi:16S rRNA (guanine527-N7)-methyltransferase